MAQEPSTLEPPDKTAASVVPQHQVVEGFEELVIGRPLEQPVYDVHGVLLLAAGKTVTAGFKRLLTNHVIENVEVHDQVAKRLRMQPSGQAKPARRPVSRPPESASNSQALRPPSTVLASRSTFLSIADYSERQFRALRRILDQIDRCNARTEPCYGPRRQFERKPYRGAVTVFVPTPERPYPPPNGQDTFTAWSYSLSQGGMAFVSPSEFSERSVVVGIHLPSTQMRWCRGEIVRKRQILGEEFYDYGVQFALRSAVDAAALNEEADVSAQ